MAANRTSAVASAGLLLVTLMVPDATGQPYDVDPYLQAGDRPEAETFQWYLPAVGVGPELVESLASDADLQPVIVAVIDTGMDYQHPDLSWDNIWRNPNERVNAIDDDGNGYIDDVLGWDFIDDNNDPWDWVGHGTHVAGIIAARPGNGEGISGINPAAVIMPLRAMNGVGRGPSTDIAEAIYYAVANGARVINLSIAVEDVSFHEQKAIAYAQQKDVLVIVAAGNDGNDASSYTPASIPGVLTVAATTAGGAWAPYSNWGAVIDLAAPGTDILSLRAANTDFMFELIEGDVQPLQYAYGPTTEYYLATGTSFAAPIVSGAASLLLSKRPSLKAQEVHRLLQQSAVDTGDPGIDFYTGYGLLNIPAALASDPDYFIDAVIDGVQLHSAGKENFLQVLGTANADRIKTVRMELGKGEQPASWKIMGKPLKRAVTNGVLGLIPQADLAGSTHWTIRLTVEHRDGSNRQARLSLNLG